MNLGSLLLAFVKGMMGGQEILLLGGGVKKIELILVFGKFLLLKMILVLILVMKTLLPV